MSFIKYNGDDSRWNDFCFRHPHTWFRHTSYWQEYLLNSKFDTEFKNHSFFAEANNTIKAVIPLIQENETLHSPGFPDEREIVKEVIRVAKENDIKHIKVGSDIKGFLNTSGHTCIIDPNKISPTKGHKSAIKKAEKYLSYRVSDTADIEVFRKYYTNIAKKETRPRRTFELLGEWIKQGFGLLLEATFEGETDPYETASGASLGYVYVLYWGKRAYYFMSASPVKYRPYNVTHFLQAKAFEILRKKGVTQYELGDQVYNSLHHQPTEKERSISKFKRSFGGEIVVKPSCEYFLDQQYMIDVYADRIYKYWERERELERGEGERMQE